MPVLAGAGGYDTAEVIEPAHEMQTRRRHRAPVGDAVLQQADAGRPVPALRAIADATPLPIVLYNVPGRTGCNIEPATLARLAHDPATSSASRKRPGNMFQIAEIVRAVPADFLVLSGDDALTLPVMALGGHGVISVASNEVPARHGADGRGRRARRLRRRARDPRSACCRCMQANFLESNPGPVKSAMAAMGLCEEVYRLPMVPPRQSLAATRCSHRAASWACRSCARRPRERR